jgi:quinoprotein glucose dehydrogenase
VPASDVPGEKASPTQPFVPVPERTVPDHAPGISAIADLASFGQCSRDYASYRDDGSFTPPSLRGSIEFPGTVGGVEWSGGAVDPTTQTYVVNSSDVVQVYKLIKRADFDAQFKQFEADRKAGKQTRPPGSPEYGSPYAARISTFLNKWGMPCWAPPYGTLSSYDLKTGKLLWKKPFGQVQEWGFYMPESWGSPTFCVRLISAPVTFCGNIGSKLRRYPRLRSIPTRDGSMLSSPPAATASWRPGSATSWWRSLCRNRRRLNGAEASRLSVAMGDGAAPAGRPGMVA